ncbi:hypothetical protein NLU13_9823 [Sarocladium strictum]|uniref:C2H2-type domain-containing protein n=1 Tax=Sarocladium strictum TaxID=5046 RepID=A0AA39L3F1_SARSR|nr:hypothetical protein NLU13_9823 [Sarocladium strictum]
MAAATTPPKHVCALHTASAIPMMVEPTRSVQQAQATPNRNDAEGKATTQLQATTSSAATPLKHICPTCGKHFKTKKAQRDHFKSLHAASALSRSTQPTRPVQRKQATHKRNDTKGKVKVQPQQPEASTAQAHCLLPDIVSSWEEDQQPMLRLVISNRAWSEGRMTHRENTYTSLSVTEEMEILARLPDICHSEAQLRQEGYELAEGVASASGKNAVSGILQHLPEPRPSQPKFRAIVLDCEMGMTAGGYNELIHLAIIDFFSGKVLVDQLVNPSTQITNWRTGITGIDGSEMREAVRRKEALAGWEAARAVLWAVADRDTIIIGQSAFYDLHVLRTAHDRIIDSAMITAEAVFENKTNDIKKRWSLQVLCEELLGLKIRQASQTVGAETHDPLEDVLATRELIILCATRPEKLREWSRKARREFHKSGPGKAGRSRVRKQGKGPATSERYGSSYSQADDSEGESPLRWEDIIDWEMWPKSP